MDNWIIPYGIQTHMMTDNGTQFVSKFFRNFMHRLGYERLHDYDVPLTTNGLANRFNKMMIARLRYYVAEQEPEWDI